MRQGNRYRSCRTGISWSAALEIEVLAQLSDALWVFIVARRDPMFVAEKRNRDEVVPMTRTAISSLFVERRDG
jgi:hypothetical protein